MDNSITSIVIFFFFSIKDPRASIQKILILIIILIIIIVSFQLGDPSIIFIYYTMMIFKMQFHEFYQLIFFTIILQFATNDHFYEQFLYSKFRVIGRQIIASKKYPPIYYIRKTRSRFFFKSRRMSISRAVRSRFFFSFFNLSLLNPPPKQFLSHNFHR